MCLTKPIGITETLYNHNAEVSWSRKCLSAVGNLCGMMGSVLYAVWELSVSTLAGKVVVMPSESYGWR